MYVYVCIFVGMVCVFMHIHMYMYSVLPVCAYTCKFLHKAMRLHTV